MKKKLSIAVLLFTLLSFLYPSTHAYAIGQNDTAWQDYYSSMACVGYQESAADGGFNNIGNMTNNSSYPVAWGTDQTLNPPSGNGCVRVWCPNGPNKGEVYARLDWENMNTNYTVAFWKNGAGTSSYWNNNVSPNHLILDMGDYSTAGTIWGFIIASNNIMGSPHTRFNAASCPVPPAPPKKYKCDTTTFSCVEDDTNGTTTSSTCDGACHATSYNCQNNNTCVAVNDASGQFKDQASCTASCPLKNTKLNLALQLLGIGLKGNLNPHHLIRPLHIQIYNKGDDPTQPNICPVTDITPVAKPISNCPNVNQVRTNIVATYDSTGGSGYFINSSLDIGTLPTGDYQILIKTPGYLRKKVVDQQGNSTFTITAGQTTILPAVKMIAGDVAPLYNTLEASDFYAIAGCYKDKANTSSCADPLLTDLNDDGVVDGIDLNIWLTGMQQLQNNNNPEGNGDGLTGD